MRTCDSSSQVLENTEGYGGASLTPSSTPSNPIDTDLQLVIDAWRALPEAIRVGILAIVDAADRG